MIDDLVRALPGFIALCIGGVIAHSLSALVEINELLLAIVLGGFFTNTVGVPERLRAGTATHPLWLKMGIILLGASLTIESILETGSTILILIVGAVTVSLLITEAIARKVAGLTGKFSSLLASGAGVCGVSAVVAVGGAVRARETQVAYAAGVVLLVDAITIIVYPAIGSLLDLPAKIFGVWAGISMLSTGPVVAVGFSHSEVAGQWATTTKLARNALIGIIALGYAGYYTRRESGNSVSPRLLWANFPNFVLGFLVFAVLTSAGVFSPEQQVSIANAVDWLFLLAFVGLGTEIRLEELQRAGVAPAFVVVATISIVSVLSLAVALIVV